MKYDKQQVQKNIDELDAFIRKAVKKIQSAESNISDVALMGMIGVVERKESELYKWREVLKSFN